MNKLPTPKEVLKKLREILEFPSFWSFWQEILRGQFMSFSASLPFIGSGGTS